MSQEALRPAHHRDDPHVDLDRVSAGVVKVLDNDAPSASPASESVEK
jgi:hypothetical protein